MANQFKLTQKVSNTFLLILKNNLVMGRLTESKFSEEFGNPSMQIGDTLTVRRPPAFIVSDGPTYVNQDVVVGSETITIDKQKHIGFTYADMERALEVDNALEDQVLNAKMAALAQQIDSDGHQELLKFAGWVGTPGETIDAPADFFEAPKRLDELAVPQSDRNGVLSPTDYWALNSSLSTPAATYPDNIARSALENARLPLLGSVQPYMSQSVFGFTTSDRSGTPLVDGANQNVNYADVRDTYTQDLTIDGLGASETIKAGEVFTIAGVNAVNPRTHTDTGFLRQFVVMEDATADGTGAATLKIAFPIIAETGSNETLRTNQAFQTVTDVPADNAAITWVGSATTTYKQNAVFHKSAIQYVFTEPPRPHTGEFSYAQDPETGIAIRLWASSDISADNHVYRCDVMYGVKNLDPRLGVRLSGTA